MTIARECSRLFCGDEDDVDRCGNLRDLAGGGERAGGLINAKDRDVVGFLIGREQKLSCWIQCEIPGCFTLRGKIAGNGQRSLSWIDGEFRDAVVAAI